MSPVREDLPDHFTKIVLQPCLSLCPLLPTVLITLPNTHHHLSYYLLLVEHLLPRLECRKGTLFYYFGLKLRTVPGMYPFNEHICKVRPWLQEAPVWWRMKVWNNHTRAAAEVCTAVAGPTAGHHLSTRKEGLRWDVLCGVDRRLGFHQKERKPVF